MATEGNAASKDTFNHQEEHPNNGTIKGQGAMVVHGHVSGRLQCCKGYVATLQNDHYKILSPSFLKITGLCISLFLCGICWLFFLQNPRYSAAGYLLYMIFVGVTCVTLLFVFFVFSSVENYKLYLWNTYFLFFIHCALFIFIALTSSTRISDIKMMQKFILCLGFLFIVCEILHAQTAENLAHDRFTAACVMGIVSSIAVLPLTGIVFFLSTLMPAMIPFTMIYFIYALYVFILSLRKKEICDMSFGGKFILICISFVLLLIGTFLPISEIPIRLNLKFAGVAFMGAWIVFGCNFLIYSGQTYVRNVAGKSCEIPFGSKFILFLIFFALLFGGGGSLITEILKLTEISSPNLEFKGAVFLGVWIVIRGILICLERSREWSITARGVLALVLRCIFFTVLSCIGALIWGDC